MTNRYDDLIARVAARARERCAPLPPTISPRDLASAEDALGFPLHPLLVRLYREVANGGFGPEQGLLPLDGAVGRYAARRAADPGDAGWFWPEGVLPVVDWGDGMLAGVDCRSRDGAVLLFEPNPVAGEWADAWFVDAPDLVEWWETSLAGRGWYRDPDARDPWGTAAAGAGESEMQPVDLPGWPLARSRAGAVPVGSGR